MQVEREIAEREEQLEMEQKEIADVAGVSIDKHEKCVLTVEDPIIMENTEKFEAMETGMANVDQAA